MKWPDTTANAMKVQHLHQTSLCASLYLHVIRTYICSGWTGVNCESDIDECESTPCQNNATCNNLAGSFNCTCDTGYVGDVCHSTDPCLDSDVCNDRGECSFDVDDVSRNATASCECDDGWLPPNCLQAVSTIVRILPVHQSCLSTSSQLRKYFSLPRTHCFTSVLYFASFLQCTST